MLNLKRTILTSAPYCFSLFFTFLMIRAYQGICEPDSYFGKEVKGIYYLKGILFDFQLALLLCATGVLLALALGIFTQKWKFVPMHILNLFAILGNFALITFYLITNQPLGESFFKMSNDDLTTAADLSSNLSLGVVAMLLILFSSYFLLPKYLKKVRASKFTTAGYGLLLTASICTFPIKTMHSRDYVGNMVANNKLSLFIETAQNYYSEEDQTAKMSISPREFTALDASFFQDSTQRGEEFPFIHYLPEESNLAMHLDKSPKGPPNVVIIIVESLSAAMIGENADRTGHMMTFLDSLSEKSLFFPNFISTCERTHNVLPAALTSIPNAPDGVLLQMDEYPKHWSLMSLLSKHYYSRFYCGVNLNYSNMVGYMNYHKTNYLVKNWEKNFSTKIDGVEYEWGHDDKQLYAQSWIDLKKHPVKKPRLDVFLTISSHYPHKIPDQAKYMDMVRKRLKYDKRYPADMQHTVEKNIGFSSFIFTDVALQEYFNKAKKDPDFDNTIFLIFGDHGAELYQKNEMDKYKTSLILYSPLVKKPGKFEAVCSHADITPTLINYLRLGYPELNLPERAPFYGQELNFQKSFVCNRTLPLITVDTKNKHLVMGNSFLYEGHLYKIKRGMQLEDDSKNVKRAEYMARQLNLFKRMAQYLHYYDKVISTPLFASAVDYEVFDTDYLNTMKEKIVYPSNDEFVDLGSEIKIDPKWKAVEIEYTADLMMNSKDILNKFPLLTVSIDNKNEEAKENIFWKQAPIVLINKFKAKTWNKIRFKMIIRMKDLPKLRRNNDLNYFLFNDDKISFQVRKQQLKIGICK